MLHVNFFDAKALTEVRMELSNLSASQMENEKL